MEFQRFVVTFGTKSSPKKKVEIVLALLSLLFGIGVLFTLGGETLFLIALFFLIAGIVEGNKFLQSGGERTHILSGIAVGVWFAMLTPLQALATLPHPTGDIAAFTTAAILFLFFRYTRISTIGWLYRRVGGALGVLLSDLLAGFAAGMATLLVIFLSVRLIG